MRSVSPLHDRNPGWAAVERRPIREVSVTSGSLHRLEVVLFEVVSDLLAEDRALDVGGAEVDAAPDARVDDLLERHRRSGRSSSADTAPASTCCSSP